MVPGTIGQLCNCPHGATYPAGLDCNRGPKIFRLTGRRSTRLASYGYSMLVLLHSAGVSPADRSTPPSRKRSRSRVMLRFSFDGLSPSVRGAVLDLDVRPCKTCQSRKMRGDAQITLWAEHLLLLVLK